MTTVTSTERPSTLSERLDPRNWSLVAKLAVVGLVPTVLALSIGALRVVDQANVAEELGRGSSLVDVHRQIGALTGALQAERNATVTFVGGNRSGDRAAVDRAQAETDTALRDTTAQLDAAEEQAPELANARRQAETTLGELPAIRAQSDGPAPVTDVTSRYTTVVERTLGLDRALVGRLQTADTAGLTSALGAGANAQEALELQRTVLNGAIAAGRLDEAQRAQVTGAEAAFQAAAGDFRSSLTPEQTEAFGDLAAPAADAERNALRDQALAAGGGAPPVDPAAWNGAVDRSAQAVEQSTQAAEQAFTDGRAAAAEEAGNTAGLNSVLLMLTLLLTGGIILLLGRQMVRSLRLLRSSALEVAERKLPAAVQSMRSGEAPNALVEPVPLDSRDEIGEVARAFDAVHGQAIRLAADQAALQQNVNSMFVNLSRRSQALVERQLQLIEQLESNEQDPDQLSNLFQLDHLATRMRRNSENLLVLAGTDLAKRNVAPVQVVDVLRAAVSEVEQYQRVVVQTPPTATIAGRAANDLVHLLAELLDNATNFSPPDSQVVMSTTRTADESLLIEISDRGVGMTDTELVDANQRLAGPAEVDVSASRRMGLFVVGRLAARHRVGVRLASAVGGGGTGGLNASVTVPVELVPSAQLPEQRRDGGGPAGPPRGQAGLPQRRPGAPSGPAGPEAPAAAHGGAPAPAATNGADRSSLPSLVAGSDGPLTPTFETGTTVTGGARNGSSAALPTRKPGSSLRRNAAGDAPDGQEASANGVAPHGLQAFAPSRDGETPDGRTPADVFTPPEESGSAAAGTGSGPADTGTDAPAAGGPPEGPDAFRAPPGSSAPAGDGSDEPAAEDTDTGPATDPRSGTAGAGAAAALGLAGAAAAGAAAAASTDPGTAPEAGTGRQAPPADRELDDTVVIDAAVDDTTADRDTTAGGDTAAGDTAGGDTAGGDTAGGPGAGRADRESGTDPAARSRTDADAAADTDAPGAPRRSFADARTPDSATTNGSAAGTRAGAGSGTGAVPAAGSGRSTAFGAGIETAAAGDAAGTTAAPETAETAASAGSAPADAGTTGAVSTGATPDDHPGTGTGSGSSEAPDRPATAGDRPGAGTPDSSATGTAAPTGTTADEAGTTTSGAGTAAAAGAAALAGAAAAGAVTSRGDTEQTPATRTGTDATGTSSTSTPSTGVSSTGTAASDTTGTDTARTDTTGAGTTGAQTAGADADRGGAAATSATRPGTTRTDGAEQPTGAGSAEPAGANGEAGATGETGGISTVGAGADRTSHTGTGHTATGTGRETAPEAGTAAEPRTAAETGDRLGTTAPDTPRDGTDGDTDDTATAAFPTVRPTGREPMGGPPASRTNGGRPSPGRRPVMPGGRGPVRGPSTPADDRPDTDHRDTQRRTTERRDTDRPDSGLPRRIPGGQAPAAPQAPGTQAPGTQAPGTQAPGPNGTPVPTGGPAPLPKRQVPPRGAAGGPARAGVPGAGAPGNQGQDELFAPKVPVEGDRGQLRRPGGVESARGNPEFDMGQTTPIFDDIASAWFRSNRSVPVRWQDGGPAQAGAPAGQAASPTGSAVATGTGQDQDFTSPADDVWRQAREAVGEEAGGDRPDELTSAGLPKRRPRARLLPGSAAGSTVLSPSPSGEPRDAETVRGRLASYQQGVRQGRESAAGRQRTSRTTADGVPEPSADRSNQSDPEENQ
ncbi:Signal transduction histidine kinase [Pseudonocardia ammonioxydans]|uniref:histidine kinase n=1 Tax=Pseudonocardia ammonioxydans TaxID=260086 RepID=A0A1I4SCB0_PSUAM|nr:nitrate- and nitrite sensing domain-containing protein [Pseudonocardia ammonioxydans]SFM62095.1 Signal transduction histidine kinase [Pseudonocardia ammonioxydans]